MSIISSETKSHGEGQGDYSGMLFLGHDYSRRFNALFFETLILINYYTITQDLF